MESKDQIKVKQLCNVKIKSEVFSVIMKYLDLREIYTLLLPLNKEISEVVSSENYILLKKFLAHFCLDSRLKRKESLG